MVSCPCCGRHAGHRAPCPACGSLRTMATDAAPSLPTRPIIDEAWARVAS